MAERLKQSQCGAEWNCSRGRHHREPHWTERETEAQSVWAGWIHSPRSELQKAVCGWGGTQVQARLGAVSHSSNRMPEARGAKGAMVRSVGVGRRVQRAPSSADPCTWAGLPPHSTPYTHRVGEFGDFKGLGDLRAQGSLGG